MSDSPRWPWLPLVKVGSSRQSLAMTIASSIASFIAHCPLYIAHCSLPTAHRIFVLGGFKTIQLGPLADPRHRVRRDDLPLGIQHDHRTHALDSPPACSVSRVVAQGFDLFK